MHRETKRQILDLLTTLEEAISYLQRNPENNREGLLRDCSLCAKSIVVTLRKDSEAHEKHVHLLAQFTEKIKQAQTGDLHAFRQALSAAKVKLAFLRRKMEKLATKLEVVFLPYKASMWDSLESIWRAANEDPDCDAYVVPIPYYDLNPDHTPAKFHYEGDLYPEDVPITDYRKYDLVARRPDVIYIHNPYDGCNCVTSVDPAYYSDRLKQCTEMLVYVPYFVSQNDYISEHYCQLPGVINANQIIVQSEKICRIYGKYVSLEKVVALGSPKFDRVVWTQEHLPSIPEEWKQLAKGRKLVLYNTHLSQLIVDDGSVCKKLRYVFECFKKHDNVCLLWRPHPLSSATMESMNPQALMPYLALVEEYKREKIGIYDDSSDVQRAIALSTAYYGNVSSLVPMYGMTGKPMLIHSLKFHDEKYIESFRDVSFTAAIFDQGFLWFSAKFFNGLFKMSLDTGNVHFIGMFPGEIGKGDLHSAVVKVGEKLYFIPGEAESIAEVDLLTERIVTYPVTDFTNRTVDKFLSAVSIDQYLYLIPSSAHVVLRFDVDKKEVHVYDEWFHLLRKNGIDPRRPLFSSMIQVENTVWCACRQKNVIVKIVLPNVKSKIYKVGDETTSFFSITHDGKYFWLIPNKEKKIIRWDVTTQQMVIYSHFPREIASRREQWSTVVNLDHFLWIFPLSDNGWIKMDKKTGGMEYFLNYPKDFEYTKEDSSWVKYGNVYLESEIIYLFPGIGNMLLKIDTKQNEVEGVPVKISSADFIMLKETFKNMNEWDKSKRKNFKEYFYQEAYPLRSLSNYLNFIATENDLIDLEQREFYQKMTNPYQRICGKEIHAFIRNLLGGKI